MPRPVLLEWASNIKGQKDPTAQSNEDEVRKYDEKSDERNLRPVRERICQGWDEQASGEMFEKE
jgi:hypothetical protein